MAYGTVPGRGWKRGWEGGRIGGMNAPHWIDKHFTSPQERAAKILADEDRRARDARGRALRLVFLTIPLLLVGVALLGASVAAGLNYYGVIDLTAYAPQLPRKAPEVVAAPALNAAPAPDMSALILAPYNPATPIPAPVTATAEPVAAPEAAQPAGQPISTAHAQHLRDGIAMMDRELAEADSTIAFLKSTQYVRPWPTDGGRPAPWTDAEHLVELEAYARHSRMNDAQAWDYRRAHDAWVANVGNDRKRLAETTAKRASIAARQDKAKAGLDQ